MFLSVESQVCAVAAAHRPGLHTFENLFFFFLWKSKELFYTLEEVLLQLSWNTMTCDLEESVVQTALSDLFNQLGFGNLVVAIEGLMSISDYMPRLDQQLSYQRSPRWEEPVR